MIKIKYPKVEDIIKANKKVLEVHKATKADSHKLLSSRYSIQKVINKAKRIKGDIYAKARILLVGINRGHFFASGNKRTAYFVVNNFLYQNKEYSLSEKKEKRRFMLKVRSGNARDGEIEKWLGKK